MALFGALWLAVLFGVPPFLQIVTRLPVFASGHNTPADRALRPRAGAAGGLGARRPGERAWRSAAGAWRWCSPAPRCSLPALFIVAARRTSSARSGTPRGRVGLRGPARRLPQPQRRASCVEPCIEPGNVIRLASLIMWLTAGRCGVRPALAALQRRIAAALVRRPGVLLVCVDLFRAGMGYNPAIDRDYAEPARARAAIRLLERSGSARFVGTGAGSRRT